MVTDPIADLITRLKNASMVGKESTVIPFSRLTLSVAEVLKRHDYVKAVNKRTKHGKRYLEVELNYVDRRPKINAVSKISKPSRRIYERANNLKPVKQGFGHLVVSTPKGVMTGDEARAAKVGGEVLFKIW